MFVGVLPVEHLLYEGDDLLVLFDFLNNLTALRFFDVVTIKQVFDHFHDILNCGELLLQVALLHVNKLFVPISVDVLQSDFMHVSIDKVLVGSTLLGELFAKFYQFFALLGKLGIRLVAVQKTGDIIDQIFAFLIVSESLHLLLETGDFVQVKLDQAHFDA